MMINHLTPSPPHSLRYTPESELLLFMVALKIKTILTKISADADGGTREWVHSHTDTGRGNTNQQELNFYPVLSVLCSPWNQSWKFPAPTMKPMTAHMTNGATPLSAIEHSIDLFCSPCVLLISCVLPISTKIYKLLSITSSQPF